MFYAVTCRYIPLHAVTCRYRYAKKEGLTDNDYSSIRAKVNRELLNGYFGPSKGGVYSVSLQATTIFDRNGM